MLRLSHLAITRDLLLNQHLRAMSASTLANGDLNNISALRTVQTINPDLSYASRSLAIPESEDDSEIRRKYRPFLLPPEIRDSDWVSKLELSTVLKLAEADLTATGERVRILVLYGSLRARYVRCGELVKHSYEEMLGT